MKAGEYGIKNLKYILPKLPEWLNEKGEDYKELTAVYNEVITQYNRYLNHVATNIGGIMTNYKTTDQSGAVFTVNPRTKQKEAVAFIHKQLFETPNWLLEKSILEKTVTPVTDRISSLQDAYLGNLLSTARLQRLVSSVNRDPSGYRIDEYMDDLKKGIFTELSGKKPIDNYRRNLQKSFVERLGGIVNPGPTTVGGTGPGITFSFGPVIDVRKSDIMSVAKGTLRTLKAEISASLAGYTDRMSKYHLQDLNERIDRILNPR
jgi:hypothetical protein